jgi:hypothetical protein
MPERTGPGAPRAGAAEANRRDTGDNITILQSRGRRLAKLIGRDGCIVDYDSARLFDLAAVKVSGLDALESLLRRLARRSDYCIVRGAIADPLRTRKVRRLLHRDPQTGDGPTLCDEPRRWLALDVDALPRPEATAPSDLVACARIAIEALPAAFRSARCIAQATASHGLKPGMRLRLWVWLSRAVTGAELRRWLRTAPVDHAVFSPAQIIYTAAPVFAAGAVDPLSERLALLSGARDAVPVPAAAVLAPPKPTMPPAAAVGGRYGFAALAAATARVARAPDGQRHPTLLGEARGLARLVSRRLLTEQTVTAALVGAAAMAGLPAAEATATIAWALARTRSAPQ